MTPYANCPHTTLKNSYGLSACRKKISGILTESWRLTWTNKKPSTPLTRRGRKDSKLALEDRLLLTLYYLRHYPTLINLAAVFGISEFVLP